MSLTPEQLQERNREYQRRYREANKEKRAAASKAYREENRERDREYRKSYREANKDAIKAKNRRNYLDRSEIWILSNIRRRAKELGLPCDLVAEDIVPPEFCPVLGLKLERSRKGRSVGPQPNSPSVDRIIPERGYIKSNVIVISHLANCIKQNATPEQIRRVADFFEAKQQEVMSMDLKELKNDS